MGAWGTGILQNDTAQDGLNGAAYKLLSAVPSFAKNRGVDSAAQLGAAVGLLLQFSPYSFNTESPDFPNLVKAIEANNEFLADLSGRAEEVIRLVADGRGGELAERPASLPSDLSRALHGIKPPHEFAMQKIFAFREDDLFGHSKAIEFTQQFVNELVDEVDEGFADEEVVSDLSREGDFMGAFALLLIIEPCTVPSSKFKEWRTQFQQVWDNLEPTDDEMERKFEGDYRPCVELALEYGVRKHG